eukprot:PhF_6_TR27003/c0_g1_i1/m.39423
MARRVLFDFTAAEDGEISVTRGEVVTLLQADDGSGWASVETTGQLRRRGFVPSSYLDAVLSGGSPAGTSGALPAGNNPLPPANPYNIGGSDSRRGAADLYENPVGNAPSSILDVTAQTTTTTAGLQRADSTHAGNGPILTVALEDSFLMNEVYYKQLVKQRQEAFARLESCVTTVTHEIRVCKERNSQLTRKVRELDSIIDQERRKWRERVEEEKAMLAKRSNYSQQ